MFDSAQNQQFAASAPFPNRIVRKDALKSIDVAAECKLCKQSNFAQLACGHNFHIDCVNHHAQYSDKCPLCNSQFATEVVQSSQSGNSND